jgi:hypothetical protein
MEKRAGKAYYSSRRSEILALFDDHAQAWKPLITERYGDKFADTILKEACKQLKGVIPEIPYIGGDENPMTHHLIRSTTSLAFYKAMKARGKTAEETGKIIYDAVVERVSNLPPRPLKMTPDDVRRMKDQAKRSHERRYPGDWVREYVEGDGVEFDYGFDFFECGTQKLYHAHSADEFLPYYCFLDFPINNAYGKGLWGFTRTMTLAEGHGKCDFRFKQGGKTEQEWPPRFLKKESWLLGKSRGYLPRSRI